MFCATAATGSEASARAPKTATALRIALSVLSSGDRLALWRSTARCRPIAVRHRGTGLGGNADVLEYRDDEPIAARPEEQIHIVENRPELDRQRLPQQFVGAMEARLDRVAGNAETGRRLLDAHLLDGAQHEDAAEIRRQLVYRFLDGAAD